MNQEFVTVTTKGQLVIPVRFRRKLGIRKGTRVAVMEDGQRLVLQPINIEFIRSLRGSLRGEPSMLRTLLEERKKDREL